MLQCSHHWEPSTDEQIVYGVVAEPDTIDLQGDRLSKAEIRQSLP